jgi:hypothetical protein
MLLSGGEAKDISTSSLQELNFPVHTFGLGADHEARSFRCIASKNAGTYSFISNGKTRDAFKAFIGGLTSVAATSVKISIKAQAGFCVSSIVTGSHKEEVQIQGSCHDIQIGDMYAGETKNFIVYLQTQSAEVSATTAEKLVAVGGRYQLGCLVPAKEITITHDSSLGAGSNTAAVAAELVRIKLVNQVTDMVEREPANLEVQELQRAWESIKVSTGCQGADSTALSELEKDVAEMTKPQGTAYMLSWLSCHQWQRATTMLHHSCAFKVRAPSTSTWGWKFITNRTLVCGVVFLFALLVTLLRLGIFIDSPVTKSLSIQPTALDIVTHPSWPTMKDNLGELLNWTKKREITTFFQDQKATSQQMNQQIDQYLYMVSRGLVVLLNLHSLLLCRIMCVFSFRHTHPFPTITELFEMDLQAILYAAVLRARYDGNGTADISEKVVKHQAEVYLHSMLKQTKQYALPSSMKKNDTLENVAGEMSRYLYSVRTHSIFSSLILITMVIKTLLFFIFHVDLRLLWKPTS